MGNNSKNMDYSKLIIARIQSLCEKKGYSINKLANLSNVRKPTLRGITKNPGIISLHKIANTFNLTLAEFLNFDELNNFSFDE